MKKYLLMLMALTLGVASYASAYQQQGFNQYSETNGGISFFCQNTCAIMLGEAAGKDMITINGGTHQGTGIWGYGYLLNSQVYPSSILPADQTTDAYTWIMSEDATYSQLPSTNVPVMFLVVGPLRVTDAHINLSSRTFGAKVTSARKGFWKTENIAPYSINLHYGPKVGTWSWVAFGCLLMVLTLVVWGFAAKKITLKKLLKSACVTLAALVLIGGIRLLIDDVLVTSTAIDNYTNADESQRTFLDLRNYISVTDSVRKALHLDDLAAWQGKKCTIYAKSNMSWPFDAHWNSVYLRPCDPVLTGSMADYQLYYNADAANGTGTIIAQGKDFVLFDNRAR